MLPAQLGHRQGCKQGKEVFSCPSQADTRAALSSPPSSNPGGMTEQLALSFPTSF